MSVSHPAAHGKHSNKLPNQALTDDEVKEVVGSALHYPSVFKAVTTHITPNLVTMLHGKLGIMVNVIDALQYLDGDDKGPSDTGFWPVLKSTVKKRCKDLEAEDSEREEILEWIKECQKKGKDEYSESVALKNLPRCVMALSFDRMSHDIVTKGTIPTSADLSNLISNLASISTLTKPTRLSAMRTHLDTKIEAHRGRELLGLKSGIEELDRRTDGLRGLTLLGAKPGSGKTTKAIDIALGIARHVEVNDAAVIIVSADMPPETLYVRMLCNLGGIEYTRYVKGSPIGVKRKKGWPHHSKADAEKIEVARSALDKLQDRLFVIGADDGQPITASSLTELVTKAKQEAKCSKAFLVVDYLQLLAVPDRLDDLSADRHRISELQRVIETSRKQGDDVAAVLAISEMRKPVGERKSNDWGTGVEDLMGTARLGYAADAALLCRGMTPTEMAAYYPGIVGTKEKEKPDAADKKKSELEGKGIAPVMFALAKGRDGAKRGKWAEEFHFNTSQFTQLKPGTHMIPADDE